MEGTLLGIPSIAVSQAYTPGDRNKISWDCAEQHAPPIIRRLLEEGIPKDILFNLNFPNLPPAEVKGVVSAQKITFTPGSAEISSDSLPVIAKLAEVLKDCPALPMEIAGHTDAQGSESGNKALSQARAEAVLLALQGRRVDVSGMTAVGYGEGVPIADNTTEEGREANRRIDFVLKVAGGAAADAEAEAGSAPAGDAAGGPDFSGDTSPSVAPTEKTRRPKPRPAQDE